MGRGSKLYFGKTRGFYKSVNFSNENVDPEQGTEETPKEISSLLELVKRNTYSEMKKNIS